MNSSRNGVVRRSAAFMPLGPYMMSPTPGPTVVSPSKKLASPFSSTASQTAAGWFGLRPEIACGLADITAKSMPSGETMHDTSPRNGS